MVVDVIIALHKIWTGSMLLLLRNPSRQTTDNGRLRLDSTSADKVKQS